MDFELLPDLVLYRVFSFFDSFERSQLKRVCKRWLLLLQVSVVKTLAVYEPRMRSSLKWLEFVASIDSRDVCEVTVNNQTISYLPCNQMIANKQLGRIKKMYAFGISGIMVLLSELVSLKQLEILKLENCANRYPLKEEIQIDLPNLCIFSIKNCFSVLELVPNTSLRRCFDSEGFRSSFGSACRIRAPNLAYCALPNFENNALVQLECFEKIRYIKCDFFDRKTARKTVNLETLVCKRLELPFRLDELPKLKEVALFPFSLLLPEGGWITNEFDSQLNFEIALKSLRDQKTGLSRSNLKIVVNGFKESIDELSDLNEELWLGSQNMVTEGFHVCFTAKNAEPIARNYGKIVRPLPFRTKINYTNLTRVFNGQIPANFFEKFPEIVSVSVSEQVDNESDLMNFLQNCSDLQCLELKNCRYDHQFYLQLLRFQSLWHLIIQELSGEIDFGFILQFRNLITFELQSDRMPLDLAYEFLKEKLKSFIFSKLNSNIEIKIVHHRSIAFSFLFIDGQSASLQGGPSVGQKTMDNLFSYLKLHEYRKFFI